MRNEFKDIRYKKSCTYRFDDMNNIKNLDPNKTRIDEKSYKSYSYLLQSITCRSKILVT